LKVLIVGIPGTKDHDYVFTHHIVRIRAAGPNTSIVVATDGTKYTFQKNAEEIVDIILDRQNKELESFLDADPGTETVQ
jgi:uncharacterized protein YlzI (FlbEa/FlbD family)